MIASWSKTIQSVLACGPRVLFLPTKQSARPIYSHDNATWKSSIMANYKLNQVGTTLRPVLLCITLVRKRVKVIKIFVWIGERENEGMKAFSCLFLQTFVVIYGQSCSEQQKKCAIVRVCLNSQSISCTSG